MKIKLWADLIKGPLEASVKGDVLTINGEEFDFSGIPDGYRLPASAVNNRFFMSDFNEFIERKGKTLYLTLKFPVEMDSPEEVRNPSEPIVIDARSGPVKFPDTTPVVVELSDNVEVSENVDRPESA